MITIIKDYYLSPSDLREWGGINWLYYDESKEVLILHNYAQKFLDFFHKREERFERMQTLHYKDKFGIPALYKAIDKHPTKSWLALGGSGGHKWLVYDYEQEKIIHEQAASESITGVSFHPNGDELWISETRHEEAMFIYNLADFSLKKKVPQIADLSKSTRWHPSLQYYSFVQMEGGGSTVKFFDAEHHQQIGEKIDTTCDTLIGINFSPKGDYVVFNDESIYVYEFPSLKKKYIINHDLEMVQEWESELHPVSYFTPPVIFTVEDVQVLCAVEYGLIWFWELETGKLLIDEDEFPEKSRHKPLSNKFYDLRLLKNNRLLTANNRGEVFLIDYNQKLSEIIKKK